MEFSYSYVQSAFENGIRAHWHNCSNYNNCVTHSHAVDALRGRMHGNTPSWSTSERCAIKEFRLSCWGKLTSGWKSAPAAKSFISERASGAQWAVSKLRSQRITHCERINTCEQIASRLFYFRQFNFDRV